MTFKPLNDNILVRSEKTSGENKTAGGIILPGKTNEQHIQGEVIAVGAGFMTNKGERIALSVKEKDTILFSKNAGRELTIDNEKFLLISEHDVYGILS